MSGGLCWAQPQVESVQANVFVDEQHIHKPLDGAQLPPWNSELLQAEGIWKMWDF